MKKTEEMIKKTAKELLGLLEIENPEISLEKEGMMFFAFRLRPKTREF